MTDLPPPAFADPGRRDVLAGGFPAVEEAFARLRDHQHVPGVAFGVVIDGELAHAGGFGLQDLASARPMGPDSVSRIASMTKCVTAAAILLLRDDGALRLDDPVSAHVPEVADARLPTADTAPLTIRQLLTMSGGLVEDDPWADRQLAMDSATFSALLDRGIAFDLPPGTAYQYSNLGYAILGRVVENVTGTGLREVTTRRLFAPLGMTATTWDADRIDERVAVRGYRGEGATWVEVPSLGHGAFGAMGGLATSVSDFARYVAFHLDAWPPRDDPDTGPLARSSRREMAQVSRGGPTYYTAHGRAGIVADGYGYGLVSALHKRDGRLVAHSGGLPGFGSHVEWLPDHGVGIVAFANRTYTPVRGAVRAAFDALAATGGLQPRTLLPTSDLLAVQDAVTRLYRRWDDGLALAVGTETLFQDCSLERRRRAVEDLRSARGDCSAVGPLIVSGALRATWAMECANGRVNVTVSLAPTPGGRIQSLSMA